jgi:signal transduction histidine kinase
VTTSPLPETGTIETRQASRAFNDMQVRLRNLIENRTRLLAAISHDLRTPLTLLRLRAENVEDLQERDKILATIAEMDAMVAATLQFARDEAVNEARRPTDLTALLQSVVDDMADAGLAVRMEPAEAIVYDCRPDLFGMADLVNAVVLGALTGGGGGGIVFPIVLIPAYAVPRAFLVHSYSLIGLLRKTSRHSAPAESLHYGIETART